MSQGDTSEQRLDPAEFAMDEIRRLDAEVVGVREQLAAAADVAERESEIARAHEHELGVLRGRLEKAQAALQEIARGGSLRGRYDFHSRRIAVEALAALEDAPLTVEDYRRAASDMPEKLS